MSDKTELNRKAEAFHALHVVGRPVVIFNVWDAGTAKAATAAGCTAIATGSWSVAAANGFEDGEQLPLELALDNLRRIVRATPLPVSIDIESGSGQDAAGVASTIARTIEAGAVGCNLEDSYPENGRLRPLAEQVERITRARRAADEAGVRYFINARTDVFFQKPAGQHDTSMVEEALERARSYADAGASGIFVPGLVNLGLIERFTKACRLPVNVMVAEGTPALSSLAQAGIARVSHGPGPFRAAMKAFEQLASAAIRGS